MGMRTMHQLKEEHPMNTATVETMDEVYARIEAEARAFGISPDEYMQFYFMGGLV